MWYIPVQLEENVESISDGGTESLAKSAGRVEAGMSVAVLDSTSIERKVDENDAQLGL